MDVKELNKWFLLPEYDKEEKEFKRLLKLGKIKGKNILIIDAYGAMSLSFKFAQYAKSVTAIHNDKKIINHCKKKKSTIKFLMGNVMGLKFPNESFDVIISAWAGLHYHKNKALIVKVLKRILKKNGTLLIEEADETSEYVKILNIIAPKRKLKIKQKRAELKNTLRRYFAMVENKLRTYYRFKNKNQFKGYFRKEIIFDEKKKYTLQMDKKLDVYITKKRTLNVEERSIIFVCK